MGDSHRYYMGTIRAVLIYYTKACVAHDVEHMVLEREKMATKMDDSGKPELFKQTPHVTCPLVGGYWMGRE